MQRLLRIGGEARDPVLRYVRPQAELVLPLQHRHGVGAEADAALLDRLRSGDPRESLPGAARQHDDARPRAAVPEHFGQAPFLVPPDARVRLEVHGYVLVDGVVPEIVLLHERVVEVDRVPFHVLHARRTDLEGYRGRRGGGGLLGLFLFFCALLLAAIVSLPLCRGRVWHLLVVLFLGFFIVVVVVSGLLTHLHVHIHLRGLGLHYEAVLVDARPRDGPRLRHPRLCDGGVAEEIHEHLRVLALHVEFVVLQHQLRLAVAAGTARYESRHLGGEDAFAHLSQHPQNNLRADVRRHRGVQAERRQFVLVHELRTGHGLRDRHEEVVGGGVQIMEGLEIDSPVGTHPARTDGVVWEQLQIRKISGRQRGGVGVFVLVLSSGGTREEGLPIPGAILEFVDGGGEGGGVRGQAEGERSLKGIHRRRCGGYSRGRHLCGVGF
mmetsp:Transcript_47092/g.91904  ORF Transcript_47092/g.91904 Transcript_47092/m.91904 type:complete len:438 (+) Transcript_47092:1495-2808(+)